MICSSGRDAIPLRWRAGTVRIDFISACPRVQFLDRTAAHNAVTVQDRPENDTGLAEITDVQGVLALQGGDGPHLLDVLVEEPDDLPAGEIVYYDLHLLAFLRDFPVLILIVSLNGPVPPPVIGSLIGSPDDPYKDGSGSSSSDTGGSASVSTDPTAAHRSTAPTAWGVLLDVRNAASTRRHRPGP